jgi:hypothetical protein
VFEQLKLIHPTFDDHAHPTISVLSIDNAALVENGFKKRQERNNVINKDFIIIKNRALSLPLS